MDHRGLVVMLLPQFRNDGFLFQDRELWFGEKHHEKTDSA